MIVNDILKSKKELLPVVILTFNRPHCLRKLLLSIACESSRRLHIVVDGPRDNNKSDEKLVAETLRMISELKWEGEIVKHVSAKNLGCRERVISGLTKVFSTEQSVIVLEDDCIPAPEFFQFCERWIVSSSAGTMPQVACGTNHHDNSVNESRSKARKARVSKIFSPWGWATTAGTWSGFIYFVENKEADAKINSRKIGGLSRWMECVYWNSIFNNYLLLGTSWAMSFQHYILYSGSFVVKPCSSIIENIGFGVDATHTKSKSFLAGSVARRLDYFSWFKSSFRLNGPARPDFFKSNSSACETAKFSLEEQSDRYDQVTAKNAWGYGRYTAVRVGLTFRVRLVWRRLRNLACV